MNKSLAIAVGSIVLVASGMSFAQDAKAPATIATATPVRAGAPMNMGGQMGQMDEHMKKMQALHEQMASAATPEARQQVMDEQKKEMQACMGMMSEMHAGGMMGGMGGGMKAQQGKPVDQKTQMQMMEKRMDMMQMMMQTMMDQQGASGSAMVPAPMK
jgi:hypothetical protein